MHVTYAAIILGILQAQSSIKLNQNSTLNLQRSITRQTCLSIVVGFSAATETHSVPAVIPRHDPVTFLNCNTHSGPSSGIPT